MYVYTNTLYMHVSKHTCTHAQMHVRTHAHTHVHTYAHNTPSFQFIVENTLVGLDSEEVALLQGHEHSTDSSAHIMYMTGS